MVEYTRLLKHLMKGDDVRAVKDRLVALGYLHAATHDTFGDDTLEAVRSFQRAAGLTVDGVVGPLTWAALFADGAPEPPAPATPSDLAERMCALAQQYIGHPYVWAASGQEDPTDGDIRGLDKTEADANRSIRFLRRASARRRDADALLRLLGVRVVPAARGGRVGRGGATATGCGAIARRWRGAS